MQKFYYYGMRENKFAIGCQPMKGILWSEEDAEGKYKAILVYSRQLLQSELNMFKLDFIKYK